jgi:hypothetical protein
MLITFTSDAAGAAPGWLLSYDAEIPVYCSGMVNMSEQTGIISDGSGPADYHNSSTCMWMIQPAGASELTLYFNSFNTEEEYDQVKVFDPETQDLLADLSGDINPPAIHSPSGKAFVTFSTNYTITAPGWEAYYETDLVKIAERTLEESLNIYPNPATDIIHVSWTDNKNGPMSVQISNMSGQSVITRTVNSKPGENIIHLNTENLEAGIYLLKMKSASLVMMRKLIITSEI